MKTGEGAPSPSIIYRRCDGGYSSTVGFYTGSYSSVYYSNGVLYTGGYIKQVVLSKSSNAGPFGKMTITDNVDQSGKLSGSKGYDPTDPAVA